MDKSQTAYGQLCLACEDATAVQSYWYRGRWQDGIVSFWNEFTSEEGLRPRNFDTAGSFDMCSMGKKIDVPAGESKTIRFVVSWYVPNNSNWWNSLPGYKDQTVGCWKNYYATQFAGAVEVADYCMKNWDDFYEDHKDNGKFYFLTRYGHKPHTSFDYSDSKENLYFVFGKESTGIPRDILKPHLDTCMRMPMTDKVRSLNLSNTVAIMVYEALRQQNYNELLRDEPHKSVTFIEDFKD
jgi:tRNA (cytidine(34)-2'-O)-methyltransferase